MGRRVKKSKFKKNRLFLIVTSILISLVIIGTIAYLFNYYSKVNDFELGIVKTEIVEKSNSNNTERTNILVKNIGNVSSYIRASVLIYFENTDEHIIIDAPTEDTDYSITYTTSANWILASDGYYYYKIPVAPNDNTEVLIEEFKVNTQYGSKNLMIDVVTQAIQAEPERAVEEAWGVSIENGEISFNNHS